MDDILLLILFLILLFGGQYLLTNNNRDDVNRPTEQWIDSNKLFINPVVKKQLDLLRENNLKTYITLEQSLLTPIFYTNSDNEINNTVGNSTNTENAEDFIDDRQTEFDKTGDVTIEPSISTNNNVKI